MKTFLPSLVCLTNTVLACLIMSPVSDSKAKVNDVKNGVKLYLYALSHQALQRKRTW